MLVSHKHKQLVMKLNDPGRVTAVTKGAKPSAKYPGIIYVPHTPDNVCALRGVGFKKTPSSVSYEYQWPGRYTPFDHQAVTVDFLVGYKRAFNLNGLGSGKSLAALWAADFLIHKKVINKVLIISPLSTLERVWADTIWTDFHHRKYAVLHGSAARRKKLFANTDYDFYIINPDGFGTIAQEFKVRKDVDAVIIDESSLLKDPSTDRFKLLQSCLRINEPKYLWLMTATPTPNNPYDAWGQAKILGTNNGLSYTAFKDLTMQKVGAFRWIPRPDSEKHINEILAPAIRFKTDECIDLPPTIYHTRQCELTTEQKRAVKEMKRLCSAEVDGGMINAVNEADKQNKTLQLILGFVYGRLDDDTKEVIRIDPGPRLKVLNEILSEVEGKVIVFVPYTALIHILKEELEQRCAVAVVDGSVSATKRNQIFTDFQTIDNPQILLAHPRTMSHGLTLTKAATIIWFGPVASNEIYEQANGRIVRPSQTRTTNIFHIEATELERNIFEKLRNRQAMQGSLLDYIKSQSL